MNIGKVVSQIRELKGITPHQLAEKLNMTLPALADLENNQGPPDVQILKQLSDILSVPFPLIYFLCLEPTDAPENKASAFQILLDPLNRLVLSIISQDQSTE
jgi:transcriptional regulator with XRE-family HTH domain